MSGLLGKNLTDKITGFSGTAVAYSCDLSGSEQYLVIPKATRSFKYPEKEWLDIVRLEVTVLSEIEAINDAQKKS